MDSLSLRSLLYPLCLSALLLTSACQAQRTTPALPQPVVATTTLATQLQVGDVVFIRIGILPFEKVADATASWTNHVGIVVDVSGKEPMIAESTFPFSRTGTLSRFIARSESGRVAVRRLKHEVSDTQRTQIVKAAQARMGVHYDTGFDLHSTGLFCSRLVYEVLLEATQQQVGTVESFSTLLAHNPDTQLGFWKAWFFGSIPWQRETVSPASQLNSSLLQTIFDGTALSHVESSALSGQYRYYGYEALI